MEKLRPSEDTALAQGELSRAGMFGGLRNRDNGEPCSMSTLARVESRISVYESEMPFNF